MVRGCEVEPVPKKKKKKKKSIRRTIPEKDQSGFLPKCPHARAHKQDRDRLVRNEVVHVGFALCEHLIAINSLKWDAVPSEVDRYQIQGSRPA